MVDESGFLVGVGKCIKVTPKAILVEFKMEHKDSFGFSTSKDLWIPKSVIHDDSEVFEQDGTGKIIVTQRWAEQAGLDC